MWLGCHMHRWQEEEEEEEKVWRWSCTRQDGGTSHRATCGDTNTSEREKKSSVFAAMRRNIEDSGIFHNLAWADTLLFSFLTTSHDWLSSMIVFMGIYPLPESITGIFHSLHIASNWHKTDLFANYCALEHDLCQNQVTASNNSKSFNALDTARSNLSLKCHALLSIVLFAIRSSHNSFETSDPQDFLHANETLKNTP